jgi:uncharacterized membrane protein
MYWRPRVTDAPGLSSGRREQSRLLVFQGSVLSNRLQPNPVCNRKCVRRRRFRLPQSPTRYTKRYRFVYQELLMLAVLQFLHILSGTVWAGGTLLFTFVVEPALLSLDDTADKPVRASVARYAPRLMAPFGALLFITGIGRVAASGMVTSFADLGSTYVLLAALALIITLAVTIAGGRYRARVDALLASGGDHREKLRAMWRVEAVMTAVGVLAIIAIMTILGLGLY